MIQTVIFITFITSFILVGCSSDEGDSTPIELKDWSTIPISDDDLVGVWLWTGRRVVARNNMDVNDGDIINDLTETLWEGVISIEKVGEQLYWINCSSSAGRKVDNSTHFRQSRSKYPSYFDYTRTGEFKFEYTAPMEILSSTLHAHSEQLVKLSDESSFSENRETYGSFGVHAKDRDEEAFIYDTPIACYYEETIDSKGTFNEEDIYATGKQLWVRSFDSKLENLVEYDGRLMFPYSQIDVRYDFVGSSHRFPFWMLLDYSGASLGFEEEAGRPEDSESFWVDIGFGYYSNDNISVLLEEDGETSNFSIIGSDEHNEEDISGEIHLEKVPISN